MHEQEQSKAIVLCGRQAMALRGHRDGGPLIADGTLSDNLTNEGIFRALLRFRLDAGDHILATHLESASRNAT